MPNQVQENMVVTIAYQMSIDGNVVEDAPADDPLPYLHGQENIVAGLENALVGKQVGDSVSTTLEPEDAYGTHDPEGIRQAERADFDLPEGITVGMEVEIEDAEGQLFVATIQDMDDETLTLDFNHPLAGKTITFDVDILDIREATEEELEIGEPAEYLHGHDYTHDDEE